MSMANIEAASGTLSVRVQRASLDGRLENEDRVAVEAPLEFQLHHPSLGDEPASFGATMRTPGMRRSRSSMRRYSGSICSGL